VTGAVQPAWLRRALFQVHLWTGLAIGLYVFAICASGSAMVFRRELDRAFCPADPAGALSGTASGRFGIACEPAFVTWLANFHGELLGGRLGLMWNGIGAIAVTAMCITGAILWWPGRRGNWWRSMSIQRGTGGRRFLRDIHNTMGFWAFVLIVLWALTGIYFAFPDTVNVLTESLQDGDSETSASLFVQDAVAVLSRLHFGRAYGPVVKVVWAILGIAPCVLLVTGTLMWWNRVMRKRASTFV
jgi:uncharacterized iron-regulated membrane protein